MSLEKKILAVKEKKNKISFLNVGYQRLRSCQNIDSGFRDFTLYNQGIT